MRPSFDPPTSTKREQRSRLRRALPSAALVAGGAIATMLLTRSALLPSLLVMTVAVLAVNKRLREREAGEQGSVFRLDPRGQQRALVLGVFALGIGLRVVHLFFVDLEYPFQYGGLFLEFANQIRAEEYALPATIPFYTDGGIPYAYPPWPSTLKRSCWTSRQRARSLSSPRYLSPSR
jgi:hypothetical protein